MNPGVMAFPRGSRTPVSVVKGKWRDYTSQRVGGVNYVNSTSATIWISATYLPSSNITGYGVVQVYVDGVVVWYGRVNHATDISADPIPPIPIPPGSIYSIVPTGVYGSLSFWSELRP